MRFRGGGTQRESEFGGFGHDTVTRLWHGQMAEPRAGVPVRSQVAGCSAGAANLWPGWRFEKSP